MKITSISTSVAPFSSSTWLDESRLATPMSRIERFSSSRSSWRGPGADLCWVLVETDAAEVFGIGQSRGGRVTAALVEEHLSGLLVGQDPRDIRLRTREMQLAVLPYASGAVSAMGTGAVELALWDLAARAMGQPLTRLLGGMPKQLPYYITCSGVDALRVLDGRFVEEAHYVKVPARWGPGDRDGVERTVADVIALRESVPATTGIALDCFMSWSQPFAREVAAGLTRAGVGLAWIEEPLLPHDSAGYHELRGSMGGVRIAGGEHTYGHVEGLGFLESRSVDIFQADVTWCGGIQVASVLGEVARARGVDFVPHAAGSQPWATHLLAATGDNALAEVLVGAGGAVHSAPIVDDIPGVGISPAQAGFR